jgi:hypothetical protein
MFEAYLLVEKKHLTELHQDDICLDFTERPGESKQPVQQQLQQHLQQEVKMILLVHKEGISEDVEFQATPSDIEKLDLFVSERGISRLPLFFKKQGLELLQVKKQVLENLAEEMKGKWEQYMIKKSKEKV